jgi:hypothetical protein
VPAAMVPAQAAEAVSAQMEEAEAAAQAMEQAAVAPAEQAAAPVETLTAVAQVQAQAGRRRRRGRRPHRRFAGAEAATVHSSDRIGKSPGFAPASETPRPRSAPRSP